MMNPFGLKTARYEVTVGVVHIACSPRASGVWFVCRLVRKQLCNQARFEPNRAVGLQLKFVGTFTHTKTKTKEKPLAVEIRDLQAQTASAIHVNISEFVGLPNTPQSFTRVIQLGPRVFTLAMSVLVSTISTITAVGAQPETPPQVQTPRRKTGDLRLRVDAPPAAAGSSYAIETLVTPRAAPHRPGGGHALAPLPRVTFCSPTRRDPLLGEMRPRRASSSGQSPSPPAPSPDKSTALLLADISEFSSIMFLEESVPSADGLPLLFKLVWVVLGRAASPEAAKAAVVDRLGQLMQNDLLQPSQLLYLHATLAWLAAFVRQARAGRPEQPHQPLLVALEASNAGLLAAVSRVLRRHARRWLADQTDLELFTAAVQQTACCAETRFLPPPFLPPFVADVARQVCLVLLEESAAGPLDCLAAAMHLHFLVPAVRRLFEACGHDFDAAPLLEAAQALTLGNKALLATDEVSAVCPHVPPGLLARLLAAAQAADPAAVDSATLHAVRRQASPHAADTAPSELTRHALAACVDRAAAACPAVDPAALAAAVDRPYLRAADAQPH